MAIDLVWIADRAGAPPAWDLGAVRVAGPSPRDLNRHLGEAAASDPDQGPDAVLCWAASLGAPPVASVAPHLALPDDCFHAGLWLGRAGLPRIVEAVDPAWMLGLDAPATIASTSWRLSLEACIVRTSLLRRHGLPDPAYEGLAAAGLALGHRWIRTGARMRATPDLVSIARPAPAISAADEARFAVATFGRAWSLFGAATAPVSTRRRVALVRAVGRGPAPAATVAPAPRRDDAGPDPAPAVEPVSEEHTVSVVIPTIDRAPYLRKVLDQLRTQTVAPHQILIVDQTPEDRRDLALAEDFADLPLVITTLDRPGQCTARNAALARATGTTLLFLDDDDDEIPPDLIEGHLRVLTRAGVDAVCGVAEEDGAGPLPEAFTRPRVSDVFPTNNTLLRVEALRLSGAFDPAYDRGDRADHDLGTRLYLAGARLWLEPSLRVRHRHAPRGGLRTHNARTTTFARRRASIVHRQRLSPTQIYLWMRYCTPGRVRRAETISVLSQLRRPGSWPLKVARLGVQAALLPDTISKARRSRRDALELLARSDGPVPLEDLGHPA